MKKLEMAKNAGCAIVGYGVTTIVANIIQNNTSEEKGTFKRFCIWTAGIVLGGMICKKACEYIDSTVSEFTESINKVVEEEKKEEVV